MEVVSCVHCLLPLPPPTPQKPRRSFQNLCWRLGTLQYGCMEQDFVKVEGKQLCGAAGVGLLHRIQTRRPVHHLFRAGGGGEGDHETTSAGPRKKPTKSE
ncbi:hypothetical protein ROHU_018586 [Labeo rohita]|uniref:Uncharacterized protein n=1 Tax=Labeo rohita TaxID=84645 RepID=A0A498N569_LABRO|nr:hypothetical protein ROHU_018586 [Labeo rohita]